MKFQRPTAIKTPKGTQISFTYLAKCICTNQRGPKGGVCGNCGNAILSQFEINQIEEQERKESFKRMLNSRK